MKNNSGRLVITKNGNKGRTYNSKELINGKVQVFYALDKDLTEFADKAVLCDSSTLETIGFID